MVVECAAALPYGNVIKYLKSFIEDTLANAYTIYTGNTKRQTTHQRAPILFCTYVFARNAMARDAEDRYQKRDALPSGETHWHELCRSHRVSLSRHARNKIRERWNQPSQHRRTDNQIFGDCVMIVNWFYILSLNRLDSCESRNYYSKSREKRLRWANIVGEKGNHVHTPLQRIMPLIILILEVRMVRESSAGCYAVKYTHGCVQCWEVPPLYARQAQRVPISIYWIMFNKTWD